MATDGEKKDISGKLINTAASQMAQGVTVKPFFTAILPMSTLIFQELGHEQRGCIVNHPVTSLGVKLKCGRWKNGKLTLEFC